MVFWGIVVGALAVLVLLGRRTDRRRPGARITRRNSAVESDIARALAEVYDRPQGPNNPYGGS